MVGKINAGINKFMNAKLKKICELDSSDDDDYGRNVTIFAENKLVKIRDVNEGSKRRKIEEKFDLYQNDADEIELPA